jgi:Predicted periplasmic lipoprotein (DUF2279)
MKNTLLLIFVFKLLMPNDLKAQIETIKSNIDALNPKRGPLSINALLAQKYPIQDAQSPFNSPLNSKRNEAVQCNQAKNINRQTPNFKLFEPSDTFNKQRFWAFVGSGATTYTSAVLLLNKVWYAQYPQSAFHYFDDQREWMEIDKAGHILTAYTESKWVYGAFRWSGVKNKNAAIAGMSAGMLFQTTLEVLDGFSTEWGFSWADMLSNTSGCALFGFQQAAWNEQRMVLKISNTPRNYSTAPIRSIDGTKTSSLRTRATDLYGDNYTQTFFKDYNALTFWLSINPNSFNKNGRFPAWLNIAIGYGADNMYGGYNNLWPTSKPEFVLSNTDFPRYRQFYLSLDVDLSKVKTKSKLLNTIFRTINFIKIPSPTLEINGLNQVKFHPLFF